MMSHVGPKPVKLNASKCCPTCRQHRTCVSGAGRSFPRGTMNDRLKEIEGAIMARLPEDADDFARIKARQVARLQVASEPMTDRLAAGRRVMR